LRSLPLSGIELVSGGIAIRVGKANRLKKPDRQFNGAVVERKIEINRRPDEN
jgi:hypothetical protein